MNAENPSPEPPERPRSARWPAARSSPGRPRRLAFRLIGIPVLAVAGVLLYRGLHDYFVLPECDSARAQKTLADVLKQLKVEPLRYQPLKTVSTSKNEVVCNAVLPLADGGSVNVDYSFFWQGSTAEMRYSISRKPAQSSSLAAMTT
jgi:hypothetical protein